jgi:hypothetical protein
MWSTCQVSIKHGAYNKVVDYSVRKRLKIFTKVLYGGMKSHKEQVVTFASFTICWAAACYFLEDTIRRKNEWTQEPCWKHLHKGMKYLNEELILPFEDLDMSARDLVRWLEV